MAARFEAMVYCARFSALYLLAFVSLSASHRRSLTHRVIRLRGGGKAFGKGLFPASIKSESKRVSGGAVKRAHPNEQKRATKENKSDRKGERIKRDARARGHSERENGGGGERIFSISIGYRGAEFGGWKYEHDKSISQSLSAVIERCLCRCMSINPNRLNLLPLVETQGGANADALRIFCLVLPKSKGFFEMKRRPADKNFPEKKKISPAWPNWSGLQGRLKHELLKRNIKLRSFGIHSSSTPLDLKVKSERYTYVVRSVRNLRREKINKFSEKGRGGGSWYVQGKNLNIPAIQSAIKTLRQVPSVLHLLMKKRSKAATGRGRSRIISLEAFNISSSVLKLDVTVNWARSYAIEALATILVDVGKGLRNPRDPLKMANSSESNGSRRIEIGERAPSEGLTLKTVELEKEPKVVSWF
ncbi:hypothetical protein AAMO2058_001617100 [Amorphochlora amoebiformis]